MADMKAVDGLIDEAPPKAKLPSASKHVSIQDAVFSGPQIEETVHVNAVAEEQSEAKPFGHIAHLLDGFVIVRTEIQEC